jgi:type IV secretory pathway TraG/TraD family ATPase VirD4
VNRPEEQRRDFYLFIDEFQNFSTDAFASILAEARKYRLCLVLSHQYVDQLPRFATPRATINAKLNRWMAAMK